MPNVRALKTKKLPSLTLSATLRPRPVFDRFSIFDFADEIPEPLAPLEKWNARRRAFPQICHTYDVPIHNQKTNAGHVVFETLTCSHEKEKGGKTAHLASAGFGAIQVRPIGRL